MALEPVAPDIQVDESRLADEVLHISGHGTRHPGDVVRLSTLLRLYPSPAKRVVSVYLPENLELIDFTPVDHDVIEYCGVRDLEDGTAVDWHLGENQAAPLELELTTRLRVLPTAYEITVRTEAVLRDNLGNQSASECAEVFISPYSDLVRFLPEIFHDNDFLNRFLMLFESFWKPIDGQIGQGQAYYDINLAPGDFLPWLASWIGITWDEGLPDERKRQLLHAALGLYQARGTRQALEDYLKIYTHGQVDIIEHRADNLVLGEKARLGSTVALGRTNFPHTFTVRVRVSREELARLLGPEQFNAEQLLRQRLESLIETQKPAHTAFALSLQLVD